MSATSAPLRIVMVGGGSYTWCPRLFSDLMQTPVLDGAEVILLDPNQEAAEELAAAGRTMAETLESACSFVPTASEAEAFAGAHFVIVTISTGGLDMMEHDLVVPEKYGIFHTVGDTVGPGGWARALRNVPVFTHLAKQIEKYAPRAVVLNYTNPMACLTGAICAASDLRTVGLCHGLFSTYRVIQRIFGVEEQDLAVRSAGVNHFFWITEFTVRGEPGYPLLRQRLRDCSIDALLTSGDTDAHGFHSQHALMDEFLREYGYLGYAGDRHTCEFVPGFLATAEAVLERFKLKRTGVAERRANRAKAREHALALARGEKEPSPRSRETAVDIMSAFVRNEPFVDVVNLPNEGQVENLPAGAVIETLGVVNALGFSGVTAGPLPPVLQSLVEPHCRVQLLTLDAALTGDHELALNALMLDPMCAHLPPSDVRRMGLELMEATRDWLPQF